MTAMMRSRRQADAFALLVDPGHSAAPTGSGASVPEAGRDATQLLAVVDILRARATSPEPSPDFAAELRDLLVSEAATALLTPVPQDVPAPPQIPGTTAPRSRPGVRRRRLAVVATTAVVLVSSSTGVAAASQGALPGETLYPVKRGIERVEVGMAGSPADRGRKLLGQASDRLHEVRGLMDTRTRPAVLLVPHTLSDFADEARAGSDALMQSYATTGDPKSVKTIRDFAATNHAVLVGLNRSTPNAPSGDTADLSKDLTSAASTLGDIDANAMGACVTCSELPPLPTTDPALSSAPVATPTPTVSSFVAGVVPPHTPSPLDPPDPSAQPSANVPDAGAGGTGTGDGGTTTDGTTTDGSTSPDQSSPPVVHTLPGLNPTAGPSDPTGGASTPTAGPSTPTAGPSDPTGGASDPTDVPSQTSGSTPSEEPSGLPSSGPSGMSSPTPSSSSTDSSTDSPSDSPSDATSSVGRGPIIS